MVKGLDYREILWKCRIVKMFSPKVTFGIDGVDKSIRNFWTRSFFPYPVLANPCKDRQRFVNSIVLIPAPGWSTRLSNFKNLVQTQSEFCLRTSKDARFCQAVSKSCKTFETSILSSDCVVSFPEPKPWDTCNCTWETPQNTVKFVCPLTLNVFGALVL